MFDKNMDNKIINLVEESEKVKDNWFNGDEVGFIEHIHALENILERIKLEYKIKKQADRCDAIFIK